MKQATRSIMRAFAVCLAFPVSVLAAEIQPPEMSLTMTWNCTGPFTSRYQVVVSSIKNDMVVYRGVRDDEDYWVEKAAWLTGTTLWAKKSGERYQWFDKEDFDNYRMLQPGSKFHGAVPTREGAAKWVWDYRISVDEPQRMKHALLGDVTVVPVKEKRRIYHGDYWSDMTSFIIPEKGVTVRWIYEDPRGIEDCDLTAMDTSGQVTKARKD